MPARSRQRPNFNVDVLLELINKDLFMNTNIRIVDVIRDMVMMITINKIFAIKLLKLHELEERLCKTFRTQ